MANPFPFSGGAVLLASQLNAIGEWTAFTPSWTNLTVGNGAQTFNYAQVNEIVHVQFRLTLGSTSSVGSSPYFALPVASSGYVTYHSLGVAAFYDVGTAVYVGFVAYFAAGDSAILRRSVVSGSNLSSAGLSSVNPFTWTTGDQMMGQFTYRAA